MGQVRLGSGTAALRRLIQLFRPNSPPALAATEFQRNIADRDGQQSTRSTNRKTRASNTTFVLVSLVLFGSCVAAQYYGHRYQVERKYQDQSVPTSLLDTGSLGQILRQLRLVERIPKEEGHKPGSYVFVTTSGSASPARLVITEVQPSNAGELLDRDGHCPDWIEFWNPTTKRFDVTGWHLTDDPKSLDKWTFPELVIEPGERLVVFASGKNSHDASEFHTNFRLAKAGDYVALVKPDKRTIVQEVRFGLPGDCHGVSFGVSADQTRPLMYPTPGKENAQVVQGVMSEVEFSRDSCLFESSFLVTLSCEDVGASIRFTTDSSLPTETTGHVYKHPLEIDKTMVIRAIATAPQQRSASAVTRTYLSLNQLVHQSHAPKGFPKLWSETIADYEMDRRITEPYEDEVRSALKFLPIVSLVTDPKKLFGPGGIYANTWERGFDWEIPAALEMLDFGGKPGFSAGCGIRLAGNESRRSDWKKHSLRLNFRGRYGLSTLNYPLFDEPGSDQFSTLMLRSTDDSWLCHEEPVRENAQYIRDQWTRDTARAMGRLSARGRFVHVCLNGLYWGVYNLVERPDDEFLAHELGGQPDDYITLRTRNETLETDVAGERVWNQLFKLSRRDLSVPGNYEAISKRLDLVDFIDYCLIHMYAGGEDWALVNGNNMRAYCRYDRDSRLKFLTWDGDSTFASGWDNDSVEYVFDVDNPDASKSFPHLFDSLIRNKRFRELFTSRIQRWMVDGAALSSSASRERYEHLIAAIEPALIAESARWGDVQRVEPYTPMGHWQDQKQRILREWFPNRAELVLEQLRQYWSE